MGKLIFIFLLAGISGPAWAQYKPVSNAPAVKARFAAAAQKINSIASDFIQVKNLSMLSEKVTSKGKFYFRKNNLLRMEYTTPYQYLMVINGTKVSIKDGQKTNRMSTGSSKMFQQANQLMMDCARGTVFDNPNFSVKLLENSNSYQADMTPVTREMKTLFRSVKVILQKTDFLVSQVQMVDNKGDQTTITYSGQQLNTNLADALFTIR
ncbi:LolA family protein [Niabella hirudinis]|uniref:LolA family protein n=1 Tax=Niabella hirudinis TaxID=1285929 RepID=UPI003EB9C013